MSTPPPASAHVSPPLPDGAAVGSGALPSALRPSPPPRRSGAFRCFPGSSRGRIQGLLAKHYPLLWGEVSVKWLPGARPIAPSQREATGDYSRGTLSDVLIGLGEAGREWDGFEVCRTLHDCYGWQCDFHLAAIIHAWSRGVADKLRSA